VIRVQVEVSGGEAANLRLEVQARSIEQALRLVGARYPGREARVLFPIDPQTYFCTEPILASGTVLSEESEAGRAGDRPPTRALARGTLPSSHIAERRSLRMKAMVLAAGKGTRLFPITGVVPKPMAPVAGKPIIQHIFELLARAGLGEIHMNVHHLADNILDAYRKVTHVNGTRLCITREKRLMGTAGSVKRIADHFDDTFVVIMGDALTDVDIGKVVAFHKERGALATLALMRVEDTSPYGVVELDSKRNIVGFQEKPGAGEAISNLANTGIYVLEPDVLEYIPRDTFFDFAEDVFPRLLDAGERLAGYEGNFYWSDIGTLEAYRAAQHDALSGKVRLTIPGGQRSEGLWIDRGAQLHPTVTLEGRMVLGCDVVIGRGATLIGDTIVGSDCWVRPGATIKRSILLPGSSVGERAHLEDCIVGHGYNVRAGERIRGVTLVPGATKKRFGLASSGSAFASRVVRRTPSATRFVSRRTERVEPSV
jgi:mannose-1-phosphate guanylyltransferase